MRFPFQAPPTYLLSNNVINQDIVVKKISTTKYMLSQTIVTMICKNKEPEISFQPFITQCPFFQVCFMKTTKTIINTTKIRAYPPHMASSGDLLHHALNPESMFSFRM